MRIPDAIRVSPQAIDPLSWVTRPLVSLSFAATALGYGLFIVVLTWRFGERPLFELLSVLLVTGACVWVQFLTGPLHPRFGLRRAVGPLLLVLLGLASSTWAAMASTSAVQHWWAPVGLGIFIATTAAYSTVIDIVVYGAILSVATAIATGLAFLGQYELWTGLSTIIIALSSVIIATVATGLFCFQVARHSQRLLAGAGVPLSDEEAANEAAARAAEIGTIARLGSRVAPFLEKIAGAGTVTQADRALAGQLARRLRSDLVSRANSSWLDSLASEGRLYVVDPDRRADSLDAAQRSALRGLVLAALAVPATDSGSLFLELRGQPDGSTAVALSLDLDLPEGRRVMMLAPYYLALKSSVGDISWDPEQDMLRFQVPGAKPW